MDETVLGRVEKDIGQTLKWYCEFIGVLIHGKVNDGDTGTTPVIRRH